MRRLLEERVRKTEGQLETLAKDIPVVARLRTIPGIGLITSTALVAFVGDAQRFKNGRRFASYLGLTPKENSSGGKRRLGRISKRLSPRHPHGPLSVPSNRPGGQLMKLAVFERAYNLAMAVNHDDQPG